MKFYKTEDGYVGLSGKSPRGFKGVLWVGRGGPSPDEVTEQAYGPNKNWVEVEPGEVPSDWYYAITEEKEKSEDITLKVLPELNFSTTTRDEMIASIAGILVVILCLYFYLF